MSQPIEQRARAPWRLAWRFWRYAVAIGNSLTGLLKDWPVYIEPILAVLLWMLALRILLDLGTDVATSQISPRVQDPAYAVVPANNETMADMNKQTEHPAPDSHPIDGLSANMTDLSS